MLILKLEQNLYAELGKIEAMSEEKRKDSVFRSLDVDFLEGVHKMTVEKRKYPYFYKYYLYINEKKTNTELRDEMGAKLLIAFYKKYCPQYVKNGEYSPLLGMNPEEYFHMNVIPGQAMQTFIPGKGAPEELGQQPKYGAQGFRAMDGYHEFTQEEKKNIGNTLDALKAQFADQLKEFDAILKQQDK